MTRSSLILALTAVVAAGCGSQSASEGELDTQVIGQPHPLDAYAPDPDAEAAILAPVQRLFDALELGDEALLRSAVDPSVVMHYSETLNGQTTFGSASVDALATRITSSEAPLVERMWDPVVAQDGALATVWGPYDFYVGSDLSHCGVDSFTLLNGESGWRIVGLSWTRRQPPDCPLHPEGPPAV